MVTLDYVTPLTETPVFPECESRHGKLFGLSLQYANLERREAGAWYGVLQLQ